MPACTIQRFLNQIQKGRLVLDEKTVVVMDEMGMTSLDDMHAVLTAVEAAGAKFVGVGDVEQTQPIGRGAPMRALIEQVGCARIDTVIRQRVAWQAAATQAMETQRTGEGFDAYREAMYFVENGQLALDTLIQEWGHNTTALGAEDLREHILIAHQNETVALLNCAAREQRVAKGQLGLGDTISTVEGQLRLAEGERLLFKQNNPQLHVNNGDFGTLLAHEGNDLTVRLDNGRTLTFNTADYAHFGYGYAATVHKLQGYTGNSSLCLP